MGVATNYRVCPNCDQYKMRFSVDTRSAESWGECENCGVTIER
jgi:ribosomal protein L32